MQSTTILRPFMKLFALVALCLTAFSFNTNVGLDSYEIYLNKQLLLKQSVNQPLSLRKLQLENAKDKDQIRIYYRHCAEPGAGNDRSITIKDEKGNTLKKWEFPNATGSDLSMVIPAKEILMLVKKNAQHDLCMYYSSKGLARAETLAFLRVK